MYAAMSSVSVKLLSAETDVSVTKQTVERNCIKSEPEVGTWN